MTLKEVMFSVLLTGYLIEVRYGGGSPSSNTSKVQINRIIIIIIIVIIIFYV